MLHIDTNRFELAKANKSTRFDKARELANRLGDKEPFFMEYALSHLPDTRVEALIAIAKELGKNPPAYFNRLVRNELN